MFQSLFDDMVSVISDFTKDMTGRRLRKDFAAMTEEEFVALYEKVIADHERYMASLNCETDWCNCFDCQMESQYREEREWDELEQKLIEETDSLRPDWMDYVADDLEGVRGYIMTKPQLDYFGRPKYMVG